MPTQRNHRSSSSLPRRLARGGFDEEHSPSQANVRVFAGPSSGDGVVFLRADHGRERELVSQWDDVAALIGERPLIPRLVLAAYGDVEEVRAGAAFSTLLGICVRPWCHWTAMTELERLAVSDQRDLIDTMGMFGVCVHLSGDWLACPLPPRCDICRSPRADVIELDSQVVCRGCCLREVADRPVGARTIHDEHVLQRLCEEWGR